MKMIGKILTQHPRERQQVRVVTFTMPKLKLKTDMKEMWLYAIRSFVTFSTHTVEIEDAIVLTRHVGGISNGKLCSQQ